MIDLYSSIMASTHTCLLVASSHNEGSELISWLIRPEYLCGLMLSLKVLGGALCFSPSCIISRYQAGLLLEGGTSSSSSSGLSMFLGISGIPLPPSEFLNLETWVEQLHLPVKALVFYETPLPHGRSHLCWPQCAFVQVYILDKPSINHCTQQIYLSYRRALA